MDLLKILDTKPVPAIVDARTLGIADDTSGDYWLPTTMSLYQKELTDQIVSLHYSDILRYFETNDYKEDVIVESMKTMCLNSAYVATQPCLLIDHCMPKSLITKDIPNHLAEMSGKFAALRDLINLVQEYETNTAIICRPGRTMDLLEALLLGNKVCIKRYDNHSVKSKQRPRSFPCTCHLFPSSGLKLDKNSFKASGIFDMLICLDPTVNTEQEEVDRILRHERNPKSEEAVAPIVRLVTINSVDHCELYFGRLYDKKSREFLESVTAAVVVLRDRVGTLPPDLRPIYSQNLRYLVEWLENPSISWPLPSVYCIKKYTPLDVERSLLTEVHYSQIEDELEAAFSNVRKRGRTKIEKEASQSAEINSYYLSKRLNKDYTTNPSKQDMTKLTGISTANKSSQAGYHLSSGMLTHRLIQSMGQTYVFLNNLMKEHNSYDRMNDIQEEHKSLLEKEVGTMDEKLSGAIGKQQENISKSEATDKSNLEKHQSIQRYEADMEILMNQLDSKRDRYSELKQLFLRHSDLQERINREKGFSLSKDAEKEYTSKECERADQSVKESANEIEKITEEVTRLQNLMKNEFAQTAYKSAEVSQNISSLKPLIEAEKLRCRELKNKCQLVEKQLSNVQTPRVRLSNEKNGSGRRFKNSV